MSQSLFLMSHSIKKFTLPPPVIRVYLMFPKYSVVYSWWRTRKKIYTSTIMQKYKHICRITHIEYKIFENNFRNSRETCIFSYSTKEKFNCKCSRQNRRCILKLRFCNNIEKKFETSFQHNYRTIVEKLFTYVYSMRRAKATC